MGKNRTGLVLKIAEKRTTFNWIFFLLVLLFGKGSKSWILTGLPFLIAGAGLRIMSSGTIKKNEILTDTGPYKMCRHPLYLGSLLISLGLVIISRSVPVLLYFLVFFPLTYIPAMIMEEKFLTEKFGDAHTIYKKLTPSFVPDIRKANLENFSWEQVKRNSEYVNWLVIIFLLASVLIKPYFILEK